MPSPRNKNIFYRLIWSIGHTPLRALEFIQFGILAWILISVLTGFGGFLAYGEPMVGISKQIIFLSLLHAVMLVFRTDRPGVDPVLLIPVPFLIYAWLHFRYLSPAGWEAGAIWAAYLQAYVLYFVVYNSIHSVRSARWMLFLLQIPVLVAVGGAFFRFYLFPDWVPDPGRSPNPASIQSAGGFLQDPTVLGGFVVMLVPMCLIFMAKHIRTSPAWGYYLGIGVALVTGYLLCSHIQGLAILLVMLLITPFFVYGAWKERRRLLKYILMALTGGLLFLWFGTQALRERLVHYLAGASDPAAETSRETAWQMFLDRPFFGQGLGSFASHWETYVPGNYDQTSVYPVAGYLDILAETGVLGLVLLAIAVGSIGWVVWNAWQGVPYIRLNKEVATRLVNFPKGHPIHRRLLREKGNMPTRKAALGGLMLGLLGLLAYSAWDYTLKLPLAMFVLATLTGTLAALSRGYHCIRKEGKIWIVAAALPVVLSVFGAAVGVPRYYANHLTYTSSESLNFLLTDRDLIFKEPNRLTYIETMLEKALDLVPGHGEAWALRGTVRMARLETLLQPSNEVAEEALPVLREALDVIPHSWLVNYNLARALMLSGAERGESDPFLRQAVKLAPYRPEPSSLLGAILLLRDSDSEEGQSLLSNVESIAPNYEGLQTALRQLQMRDGQTLTEGDRLVTEASLAEQYPVLADSPGRVAPAGLPVPE